MHNDVGGTDGVDVLSVHARRVLEALMVNGSSSRAELARRLSLSAATLTKVVRPLLSSGVCLDVVAQTPSTGGRPPQPIDVNPHFAHFVGVKLTGTAAFTVVTDARGRVLRESETLLDGADPQHVAEQVAAITAALREDDPAIAGLGIALSGTAMRTSDTVATSPFLHWKNVPLAAMITEHLALPVVLENDVRAVTAAEQWFGAAAGFNSFIMLTLGAGIGCGVVVHGQQVDGHLGASGLVGHLRVGEGDALCYAGHPGCANAYATTGGIAKRLSAAHGRTLDFDDCVQLHVAGDPVAEEVFRTAGRAVGAILAVAVNLLGPDAVFISGEGVAIFDVGRESALDHLRELLHWTASEVPVTSLPFGFGEWARGAAVVALQDHIQRLTVPASAGPRPASLNTLRGAA